MGKEGSEEAWSGSQRRFWKPGPRRVGRQDSGGVQQGRWGRRGPSGGSSQAPPPRSPEQEGHSPGGTFESPDWGPGPPGWWPWPHLPDAAEGRVGHEAVVLVAGVARGGHQGQQRVGAGQRFQLPHTPQPLQGGGPGVLGAWTLQGGLSGCVLFCKTGRLPLATRGLGSGGCVTPPCPRPALALTQGPLSVTLSVPTSPALGFFQKGHHPQGQDQPGNGFPGLRAGGHRRPVCRGPGLWALPAGLGCTEVTWRVLKPPAHVVRRQSLSWTPEVCRPTRRPPRCWEGGSIRTWPGPVVTGPSLPRAPVLLGPVPP